MIKHIVLSALTATILNTSVLAQAATADYQGIIEKTIVTGMIDGHVNKHLQTMGDWGSVEIARAIADKKLTVPQMQIVLTLVGESFVQMEKISDEVNRTPQVALLLVRYVELASNQDPSVLKIAQETRKHLQEVIAKLKK